MRFSDPNLEKHVPRKPVIVDFTLTANAASSTLSNNAIRPTSSIHLTPMTANAAAEAASLYIGTPSMGQVVITHGNDADNDKTFRVSILNG